MLALFCKEGGRGGSSSEESIKKFSHFEKLFIPVFKYIDREINNRSQQ
jgi:hypothetical protein